MGWPLGHRGAARAARKHYAAHQVRCSLLRSARCGQVSVAVGERWRLGRMTVGLRRWCDGPPAAVCVLVSRRAACALTKTLRLPWSAARLKQLASRGRLRCAPTAGRGQLWVPGTVAGHQQALSVGMPAQAQCHAVRAWQPPLMTVAGAPQHRRRPRMAAGE